MKIPCWRACVSPWIPNYLAENMARHLWHKDWRFPSFSVLHLHQQQQILALQKKLWLSGPPGIRWSRFSFDAHKKQWIMGMKFLCPATHHNCNQASITATLCFSHQGQRGWRLSETLNAALPPPRPEISSCVWTSGDNLGFTWNRVKLDSLCV